MLIVPLIGTSKVVEKRAKAIEYESFLIQNLKITIFETMYLFHFIYLSEDAPM